MVKIYGLVCPLSGHIRYIGKTIRSPSKRLDGHLAEARCSSTSHKKRWIRKLLDSGQRPEIWILEEVPPSESWQGRERAWIARAREMGLRLTNQTAGGEGLDYIDPVASERYRRKQSAISKRNYRDNVAMREALISGGKRSWAENREARIAALMSGWTEESKNKHAESMLRIRKSPEFKENKSKGVQTGVEQP